MRILLIEDDPNIVDFIKVILGVGMPEADIRSTHLGITGMELIEKYRPNIVILDLGLPDISGFDVLRHIRSVSSVPVLILSVRNDEAAVVKALKMGAEDYVTKPCRNLELMARIQAILRRQDSDEPGEVITFGPLAFDPVSREAHINGRVIPLTKTEAILLRQMIASQGDVVTVSALSKALWGSEYKAADAIKVYIYQLRKKLEKDPAKPNLIMSKPRAGYSLSLPE